VGEPALYICESAGANTYGISRGLKHANLDRLEDKLCLHFWYGIPKILCGVEYLIHGKDLDIRTRLDHREYFEVHSRTL
jgi:hypothetical protein